MSLCEKYHTWCFSRTICITSSYNDKLKLESVPLTTRSVFLIPLKLPEKSTCVVWYKNIHTYICLYIYFGALTVINKALFYLHKLNVKINNDHIEI